MPTSIDSGRINSERGWCPLSKERALRRPDSASHRRSIPTKAPQGPLGQTAAAPRSILKARLYRMTASFTEQMVTIYIHLGMLSRGKYSPPPCGEGQGVGCNLRADPTLSSLRSDIPPHKGEGKKSPAGSSPAMTGL